MELSTKSGTIWKDDDLDIIVADYFSMWRLELAGQPYVKSRHSAVVMAETGRSHRSVEFKHQNISAVLDELGMSWIPGYKPKSNYQNAIFDAIDRYLSTHPDILEPKPTPKLVPASPSEIFVEPPTPDLAKKDEPRRLRQLVAKYDPVKLDLANRALGKAGESFVFDIEKRRLIQGNRRDLAEQIRWVADEDGDGAGYDIASFDLKGRETLIEVKTTNGSAKTPFFLSRNEFFVAKERPAEWRIYRVHLFSRTPQIFTIAPPLESVVNLTTETWRASF